MGQAKMIPQMPPLPLPELHPPNRDVPGAGTWPDMVRHGLSHTSVDLPLAMPKKFMAAPVQGQEVCRKFNENCCFVRRCKFRHTCLNCGYPHPAAVCMAMPSHHKEWQHNCARSPLQQNPGRRGGAWTQITDSLNHKSSFGC